MLPIFDKREVSVELKQTDFLLTDEQLVEINRKFSGLIGSHDKGEETPYQHVSVTFEFSYLGKLVSAHSQLCFDEDEVGFSEVKPFTNADVSMTEKQLNEINLHLTGGISAVLARARLDEAVSPDITPESLRLWVTFEFGPSWRSFEACFGDSDEIGDQCYVSQPDAWRNSTAQVV